MNGKFMSKSCNYIKNSFEVYLEDRVIPDPDELLGRALKYLISRGQNVALLGFDNNKNPIIQINDETYSFDRTFGLWQGAKFVKTNQIQFSDEPIVRKSKIEKYYTN